MRPAPPPTAAPGAGAKSVKFTDYVQGRDAEPRRRQYRHGRSGGRNPRRHRQELAVVNAATGIASDDLSAAIRQAARDKNIKAIVLRVDSPGGSVTASDQILHAVKKAQAAGKPVVVSMGGVAASGGYYISLSANKIVAEPGTITGSIGVLTGKVSLRQDAGPGRAPMPRRCRWARTR